MLTIIKRERLAHLVVWARKEGLYRHVRHILKQASKTHDGGTIKLRLGFLKLTEEEENQGGVSDMVVLLDKNHFECIYTYLTLVRYLFRKLEPERIVGNRIQLTRPILDSYLNEIGMVFMVTYGGEIHIMKKSEKVFLCVHNLSNCNLSNRNPFNLLRKTFDVDSSNIPKMELELLIGDLVEDFFNNINKTEEEQEIDFTIDNITFGRGLLQEYQ